MSRANKSYYLVRAGLRNIAGFLPTVGHPSAVASASCLFLTSYSFGILTPVRKSEFNTGD